MTQHFHYLFDGECLLGRHQFPTLRRDRRVHADSQMTIALVQEAFQTLLQSHRRNSDSFRAPLITIIRSQDFQDFQYFIQIVERFSHSHKHEIGQSVPFRNRINLVQDLIGRQVRCKSLLTGHTELAIHLASHLRRHTKRSPVVIRNIHRFYIVISRGTEQIFHRTVYRAHRFYRCRSSHFITFLQRFPMLQGKVGHFVYRIHLLVIKPRSDLLGRKFRHTQVGGYLLNLIKSFA